MEVTSNTIPYTWWFYFRSEAAAQSAKAELEGLDYLVGIDPSGDEWLVRAAGPRDLDATYDWLSLDKLADRHGGRWDGGESGLLKLGIDDEPRHSREW